MKFVVKKSKFKYQMYLHEIQNCPPQNYSQRKFIAYRFVHKYIDHKNNFLPALLLKPKRRLSTEHEKCKAYGLSFFNTLQNAKEKYRQLIKTNRQIHLNIGTHIAEGVIVKADGIASLAHRKTGHITFHEYVETDMQPKFSIVEQLYNVTQN